MPFFQVLSPCTCSVGVHAILDSSESRTFEILDDALAVAFDFTAVTGKCVSMWTGGGFLDIITKEEIFEGIFFFASEKNRDIAVAKM